MSDLCYFRKPRVLVSILVTCPIYVCSKLGNVAFSQIVVFLYWNDWEIRLRKLRSIQSGEAFKSIILIYEVYQNEVRDSIFLVGIYIIFWDGTYVSQKRLYIDQSSILHVRFSITSYSNIHSVTCRVTSTPHQRKYVTSKITGLSYHIILFAQVPFEQMQLFMQKNKNYDESIDIDLFCPHTCNFIQNTDVNKKSQTQSTFNTCCFVCYKTIQWGYQEIFHLLNLNSTLLHLSSIRCQYH